MLSSYAKLWVMYDIHSIVYSHIYIFLNPHHIYTIISSDSNQRTTASSPSQSESSRRCRSPSSPPCHRLSHRSCIGSGPVYSTLYGFGIPVSSGLMVGSPIITSPYHIYIYMYRWINNSWIDRWMYLFDSVHTGSLLLYHTNRLQLLRHRSGERR